MNRKTMWKHETADFGMHVYGGLSICLLNGTCKQKLLRQHISKRDSLYCSMFFLNIISFLFAFFFFISVHCTHNHRMCDTNRFVCVQRSKRTPKQQQQQQQCHSEVYDYYFAYYTQHTMLYTEYVWASILEAVYTRCT